MRSRPGLRLAWARSRSAEYPAAVGEGALELLDSDAAASLGVERWFAVADREALAHHRALLPATQEVIDVEAGEERKTLAEAEEVLRELARAGARRDDGLLAFGGGVVGDLGGLCAALYQRGVQVVQVPTTLVGQVDSAYGGKTGVDLPEAKNYTGAYHMPSAVLADPRTLATLPDAELAAGFVEVLKTGLIAGGGLWERVQRESSELDPAAAHRRRSSTAHGPSSRSWPPTSATGAGARCSTSATPSATRSRRRAATRATATARRSVSAFSATLRLSGAGELRAELADVLDRHGLPTRLDDAVDRRRARGRRSSTRSGPPAGWSSCSSPVPESRARDSPSTRIVSARQWTSCDPARADDGRQPKPGRGAARGQPRHARAAAIRSTTARSS